MRDFSEYRRAGTAELRAARFSRIQPEMEVTGTFKLVKGDLRTKVTI